MNGPNTQTILALNFALILQLAGVALAVNAVFCLSAFWVPWLFAFDDNGNWHRGPLGYIPFIASFILIVWLVVGSVVRYKGIKRRESSVPIIISLMVTIAVLLDLDLGFGPYISFLNVAMTESTVFLIFFWMASRWHLSAIRQKSLLPAWWTVAVSLFPERTSFISCGKMMIMTGAKGHNVVMLA